MSLYSQFETDPKLEKGGIILEYGPNSKGQPMAFRIARAGGANDAYNKRLEAMSRKHRRKIQNDMLESKELQEMIKEVVVDTVLLGWENIEDRNGNDLPFTRENALKLFKELPDLYADINEQANRVALFRIAVREEDAKN